MRLAITAILALGAGCNSILGNGNFGGPGGGDGGVDGCTGIGCMVVDCAAMGKPPTSVSGTVLTPNGLLPLPNVLVYVPTTAVEPIADGPTGPVCASGSPVVHAYTDVRGNFKLEGVPAVDNLPLVIQVGKWRREITIPRTSMCADTALDAATTRLPKNSAEGHLPHIALTTGAPEAIECLARDIGIDDTEVTTGTGTGRVHLYAGPGGTTSLAVGGALEQVTALYTKMPMYDMLFFGCDAMSTPPKPPAAVLAMFQFVDNGGWVWLSHFQGAWIAPPFPMLCQFDPNGPSPPQNVTATIDATFPVGNTFASWMTAVGASPQPGFFTIQNGRNTCLSINTAQQVQRRVFLDPATAGLGGNQAFSWDTAASGRVMFVDIHLQANAPSPSPFPSECPLMPLSPQEKAVIFQMFDLPTAICAI